MDRLLIDRLHQLRRKKKEAITLCVVEEGDRLSVKEEEKQVRGLIVF